jgi:hypothetical protein
MADAKGSKSEFQENPLVAQLISAGAENARVLRGFIGPSRDKAHITLYQNLTRLGDTVEIPREDVLYAVDAPRSELGAVVLWVKEDAQLSVRKPQSEASPTTGPGSLLEVTKGRLRMQMRPTRGPAFAALADDVCISWCDCSICQSICQTLPE